MYYFIDYENVGANGFAGIDKLESNDTVILFYSENNCRLPFSLHKKIGESAAEFQYYDIKTSARNAADFQLVTYLGFIIASNPEGEFTIVSKDDGFNAVTRFWFDKGVTVYRNTNLYRQSMPVKKVSDPSELVSSECMAESDENVEEFAVTEEVAEPVVEETEPAIEETEPEIEEETAEPVEEIAEEKEQPEVIELVEEIAAKPAVKETPKEEKTEKADIDITALVEEISKPAADKPVQSRKPRRTYNNKPADKKEEKKSAEPSMIEQLKDLLPLYPYDIKQINEIIGKYKTKQGINNALMNEYGSDKTGVIYKAIKPLIKDKKGRD